MLLLSFFFWLLITDIFSLHFLLVNLVLYCGVLLLQCSVFLPSFYGPRKTVLKETCPHVMLLAFLTSQLLKPIFDWIFFLREDNLLSHGLKCVTAITALLIDVKMFSELWY